MPLKDREARLAYQREWYDANRARVIGKVKARKWGQYAGTCRFCGGPTIGQTKGRAAEFCQKPRCRSAHNKENFAVYRAAGLKSRTKKQMKRVELRKQKVVSIADWAATM